MSNAKLEEVANANFRDRDGQTLMEHAFAAGYHTNLTSNQDGTKCTPRDVYGLDRSRALQQPRSQDLPELLNPRLAQLLQWHHLPPHHLRLHDPGR